MPSATSPLQTQQKRLTEQLAVLAKIDKAIARRIAEANKAEASLVAAIQAGKDQLTQHAAGLVNDLNVAAASFGKQLSEELENGEAKASGLIDAVQSKVGELEAKVEPLERRLSEVQQNCVARAAELEKGLEEGRRIFDEQCTAMIRNVRQVVQDQLVRIELETKLAVRPLMQQIDENRERAQQQIRFAMDAAEQVVQARLGAIRMDANEAMELAEKQLFSRLRGLETKAQGALDEAEKRVRVRLLEMTEEAHAAIEEVEEELTRGVEAVVEKDCRMLAGDLRRLEAAEERLKSAVG